MQLQDVICCFAFVLVACTNGSVLCERPPRRHRDQERDGARPLIVGGSATSIENVPYQLSLRDRGQHHCGASILSKTMALTAGHCTRWSVPTTLSVRAGSANRESGGQLVQVDRIFVHPQFNMFWIDYDVSVLRLADELVFGPTVRPIPLLKARSEPLVGSLATVSGWGAVTEGGDIPTQLQIVEVPRVDDDVCRSTYGQYAVTPRMICFGYPEGGKDSCQGDSGGPLVQDGALVGVVSWGAGCAHPQRPGVYAKISNPELHSYITRQAKLS